jgi:hypothetical protein
VIGYYKTPFFFTRATRPNTILHEWFSRVLTFLHRREDADTCAPLSRPYAPQSKIKQWYALAIGARKQLHARVKTSKDVQSWASSYTLQRLEADRVAMSEKNRPPAATMHDK